MESSLCVAWFCLHVLHGILHENSNQCSGASSFCTSASNGCDRASMNVLGAGTGLERWIVTPTAAATPTPTPNPNPNQVLASGRYEILSTGRQNCEQYMLGPDCGSATVNPVGGPLLEIDADPRSRFLYHLLSAHSAHGVRASGCW